MGQSHGTTSYISPTVTITHTGQQMVVDGVIMEFQLTPGTEAPAEMNTWFPQKNALWMAENCTGFRQSTPISWKSSSRSVTIPSPATRAL